MIGRTIGPYQVVAKLGAGGMGEVYRATDPRLDRSVAIKVLPEHLAADPERRERFEREARAISGLTHAHICTLHDVGEQDGAYYLVMELVEGETLESRLAKGHLPLDKALEYAVQIADALDKAHRKGVVHRDLKPANIMLTKSGVKLLDFGLAKLTGDATSMPDAAQTLTVAKSLTAEGTILGTLQYMAPEQLEGKDADARTDIFAFGAVVYEMVTGRKAFDGGSQASLIGAILKDEPRPMSELDATTPPALDYIVRTCLAKEPDDRWQTARDLEREIARVRMGLSGVSAAVATPGATPRGRRLSTVAVAAIALGLGALAGAGGFWLTRDGAPVAASVSHLRLSLSPAEAMDDYLGHPNVAISPDGQRVAFAGLDGQLWIRDLAADQAVPLAQGGRIMSPTFSPDGKSIAFGSGEQILTIPVTGGVTTSIASVAGGAIGLSWGPGFIVYATAGRHGGLMRVDEHGGQPEPLAGQAQDTSWSFPYILDGGRQVIFSEAGATQGTDDGRFVIMDLQTQERRQLDLPGGSGARVAGRQIVFARGGSLMAAPFDPGRQVVTGPARVVLSGITYDTASGTGQWALADNGTLVFQEGSLAGTELLWVDRTGHAEQAFAGKRVYWDPRRSPVAADDRVAAEVGDAGDDIWVLDLSRGTQTPISRSPAEDETPVWSNDGRFITWSTGPDGARVILRKRADGSGADEALWRGAFHVHVSGYSPDNRFLVFEEEQPSPRIWRLPLDDRGLAAGKAEVLIDDPQAREYDAHISPDGRWIAYVSDTSGEEQIYVQPFPDGGHITPVSPGSEPVWSRDGHQLFFRRNGAFWSTEIKSGQDFMPGATTRLFDDRYGQKGKFHTGYDIGPDGRFLLTGRDETPQETHYLRVYQGFLDEIGRLVPTR